MCSTDFDPCDVWHQRRVRARKPYVCYECRLPIPAGVSYVRTAALFEGSWDTYRMHVECDALSGFIQHHVCGGKGLILAGGLGEEIANQDDTDGKDPDDEHDIRDWELSTYDTLTWLWDCATAPYETESA